MEIDGGIGITYSKVDKIPISNANLLWMREVSPEKITELLKSSKLSNEYQILTGSIFYNVFPVEEYKGEIIRYMEDFYEDGYWVLECKKNDKKYLALYQNFSKEILVVPSEWFNLEKITGIWRWLEKFCFKIMEVETKTVNASYKEMKYNKNIISYYRRYKVGSDGSLKAIKDIKCETIKSPYGGILYYKCDRESPLSFSEAIERGNYTPTILPDYFY